MQDPKMVNDPNAADPNAAGGADPNAADPNADPNAAQTAMSNRQLIDRLVGARGGNEEGITAEQRFQIEQETRNFLSDTADDFREEFPDATRLQMQQFVEGMLSVDAGVILRAVADAVKTTQEKEQMGDGEPKPLKVQGGGSGKSGQTAPKSMDEAVLNIANMFG